jgi:ankyrin repeat protein
MSRYSPLHFALDNDASLESIIALLEHGEFSIDNQVYWNSLTPLVLALNLQREDVALELIRRGADVNRTNPVGAGPLMIACRLNLMATASALVSAGAELEPEGRLGTLWWAAFGGHVVVVKQVLLWGSGHGIITARHTAEAQSHCGVVKLLDAWGSIQAVWVVSSIGEVRRVSKRSALKFLPKDLVRMVGSMLVCL